jgi:thiamine biosynthesis lipoprotein
MPATGYRRAANLMGTVASIVVRDQVVDPAVVDDAFAEMERIEDLFSTFRPASDVSRLSRGELSLASAHPDVRFVIETCDALATLSGGRFQHRFDDSGRIDPAAFVKGWAGDRAASVLRDAGIHRYAVNVGGDVLSVGGSMEEPWAVGIQHPFQHGEVAAILRLTDGAVATSGSYERGRHIRGGAATLASVTVVGANLGMADALSTAVYASDFDDITWLPEGYEVLVIDDDTVRWTPGLDSLLAEAVQAG